MAGAGYKLFNTGDVLTAAQVNTYLQEQTVMVFADAAARTTALSGVLAEGMITYLKSTDAVEVYNGSTWVNVASDQTPLTTKGDLFTYSTTDARLAVGNNGETLVADSSATTGLRWQGNFAAGKNVVLNGDFGIWQRGTSSTSNDIYLADRWRWYQNGSGSVTYSRQTFTPGTAPESNYEGQYFARLAYSSLGTTTGAEFRQPIEDVRTFAGRTVTLSFWAKADTNRTVALSLRQNFGSGGSGTVTTSLTSQNITSSWTRYSATVALPSISGKTVGTSSYLDLVFSLTPSATSTFDFWGVQLEASNTVTAFQTATGTLAGELAACQRYYEKSFPIGTAPANSVVGGPMQAGAAGWIAYDANNVRSMPILFNVNKRTSPTITIYNSADIATAGKWAYYTGSAWADSGANAGSSINETGFYVTGNNSGAYTQHRPYLLAGNWTAEAEL